MITAFIASQVIGIRREVVESNARSKYTYEDDKRTAAVFMVVAFLIFGPFLWPVGIFYNTGIKEHKWVIPLVFFGVVLSLAIGLWFYWFIGFSWAIYSLLTLSVFVHEWEKKKREKHSAYSVKTQTAGEDYETVEKNVVCLETGEITSRLVIRRKQ